jgi:hypothetical protein
VLLFHHHRCGTYTIFFSTHIIWKVTSIRWLAGFWLIFPTFSLSRAFVFEFSRMVVGCIDFFLVLSYLLNVYTFLTLTRYIFDRWKVVFFFVIYLYRLFWVARRHCVYSASLRATTLFSSYFHLIDLHIYCYFTCSMVIVCESVTWMINKLPQIATLRRNEKFQFISVCFVYIRS